MASLSVKFQLEEFDHPSTALTIDQFMALLKSEEDYFVGQELCTKLQTSRLRKIFYDKYGWDTQLIRKAANIQGRYIVILVPATKDNATRKCQRHTAKGPDFQKREVLVREGDWMNPNAGTTPEIYKDNHQQVIANEGYSIDMGHVLAGMDAMNNIEPVAPLPQKLMFLYKLVPHVTSNADAATWIGDLSSITGDMLFHFLQHKQWPNDEAVQAIINEDAPGADMLGNIDSLNVGQMFDISATNGQRVSNILDEYFDAIKKAPRLRYTLFCKAVGITLSGNGTIINRSQWINRYKKQLKACTAFYIASRYSKPAAYWYALIIWLGFYKKKLAYRHILSLLLDAIEHKLA